MAPSCPECKYAAESYAGRVWECRRRAPRPHFAQGACRGSVWPPVMADHWCGEFTARQAEKEG